MLEFEGVRYFSYHCGCAYCSMQYIQYVEEWYPLPPILPRDVRLLIVEFAFDPRRDDSWESKEDEKLKILQQKLLTRPLAHAKQH